MRTSGEFLKVIQRLDFGGKSLAFFDAEGKGKMKSRFLDCPNEGLERKCRIRLREFNLVKRGKDFWCKNCGLHPFRDRPSKRVGRSCKNCKSSPSCLNLCNLPPSHYGFVLRRPSGADFARR